MPDAPELWEAGIGQALRMAGSFMRHVPRQLIDDFRQSALLALWQAALSYDDRKDAVPFHAHAARRIYGELCRESWRQSFFGAPDQARRAKARGDRLPVLEQIPVKQWQESLYVLPDSALLDRELLDYVISRVRPERVRLIARRYWLEGICTKTIAHQLGVSLSVVERGHLRAFREMCRIAAVVKGEWERG